MTSTANPCPSLKITQNYQDMFTIVPRPSGMQVAPSPARSAGQACMGIIREGIGRRGGDG
jgi:hypothetical protein